MKSRIAITTVVITAACTAPTASQGHSPRPAPSHGPASQRVLVGVVTGRAYRELLSPAPYCKQQQLPVVCRSMWTLAYRDETGNRHVVSVPEDVYRRCRINDRFPDCANGAA